MVGTYYKAPEPGAEPYVKVGSRVTSGQTVCIIEAMKIMNEIESEIAGVVREVLRGGRAAGGVRPGPLPGRSQWLRPTVTERLRGVHVQLQEHHRADGAAQRAPTCSSRSGRPPTLRVNGELLSLDMPPLKPEDLKALAEQVMTPRQVKEFAEKKEADFAIGVPGIGRFRDQHLPAARHRSPSPSAPFRTRRRPSGSCTSRRCWRRSRSSRAGWCWSPASPARASRPRSPR